VSNPQRVLVVEDDVELREEIMLPGLRKFGFDPIGLGSAIELYKWLVSNSCPLVILDIGLPDDDGFTIAKHLRETTSAGIIMVTGRDSKSDHIRGLNEGADMYFSKPIDIELLANALHSLARRMSLDAAAIGNVPAVVERWKLEADGWRLVSPNGAVVALSVTDRIILTTLHAANKPVPREELLDALSAVIEEFDPARMEMVMHRLRRKVQQKTGQELPLSAVRRLGYMLSI
jgi:DNA-binding response OmpR family regulator